MRAGLPINPIRHPMESDGRCRFIHARRGTNAHSPEMPRRIRGYRRRYSAAKVYASIFAALVVLTIVVELAVHAVRTDPRDSRAIAERELQLNTLQPGERVLTNRRLLYLGLEPRELLAAPDLPPTFEERDFPIDTLVQLSAGRTWFGIAKAVVVHTPTATLRLGVPSEAWPSAMGLISTMGVRHQRAVASSAEQHAFLARVDAERRAVEAAR